MKFRDNIPEGGNTPFLKLKDKESASGVFMGDIYEFMALWENGKGREVPEGTPGSAFRFRVNFVVKDGASYVAKVWEQGIVVYKALAELHKEYNLEETLVKITRSGTGKSDTVYTIMPLRQQISPETLAHLKTIQLNDLSLKSKSPDNIPWPDEAGSPGPGDVNPEDIPF